MIKILLLSAPLVVSYLDLQSHYLGGTSLWELTGTNLTPRTNIPFAAFHYDLEMNLIPTEPPHEVGLWTLNTDGSLSPSTNSLQDLHWKLNSDGTLSPK